MIHEIWNKVPGQRMRNVLTAKAVDGDVPTDQTVFELTMQKFTSVTTETVIAPIHIEKVVNGMRGGDWIELWRQEGATFRAFRIWWIVGTFLILCWDVRHTLEAPEQYKMDDGLFIFDLRKLWPKFRWLLCKWIVFGIACVLAAILFYLSKTQ